ncbi:MAG: hypothetical protein IKU30_06420 [Clostridia bacterium]|nr:hypothetical protein [Clostridia bacterium]
MKNNTKTALILVIPILLFFVLVVPYKYANQEIIVDWLGCGCPQIDEAGNLQPNNFNANDFTRLFWAVVTVIATVVSVFLSKRISKDKLFLRMIYIISVFAVSVAISYMFVQSMLWC